MGGVQLLVVEWSVCWGGGSVCTLQIQSGFLGQRVSRAGPLPSQSGWSNLPLKVASERQRFQSGYHYHGRPLAHQHNPGPPRCVGECDCGQRCRAGPGERLKLPLPLPHSPKPTFRAQTEAALMGHEFPSPPQCPVRTAQQCWPPTKLC